MNLTQFAQDVLERGMSHVDRNSDQYDRFTVLAESDQEAHSIGVLQESNLVVFHSVTFSKRGTSAYLLTLTGKGYAICKANWDVKRNGASWAGTPIDYKSPEEFEEEARVFTTMSEAMDRLHNSETPCFECSKGENFMRYGGRFETAGDARIAFTLHDQEGFCLGCKHKNTPDETDELTRRQEILKDRCKNWGGGDKSV